MSAVWAARGGPGRRKRDSASRQRRGPLEAPTHVNMARCRLDQAPLLPRLRGGELPTLAVSTRIISPRLLGPSDVCKALW